MADIRDCIGIINEGVCDAMDMASKEKLLNKISNKNFNPGLRLKPP